MCGFSGELAIKDTSDPCAVVRMTQALRRRGPDSGGLYAEDRIGLGHRRLSILGLSAASHQPMVDAELGLGIVFNGCIYNFRELRAELQAQGFRFFSDGDTEVILKAYAAWGTRCVTRFYGMFAFAIWERDSGRLVLARDRLGIKPLYLTETPGKLRFASTLPALLAGGGADTAIDAEALHYYMSLHALVPAPLTILKGIRKLPPATILTVNSDGSRREEVYWTLSVGTREEDSSLSEEDWRQGVHETMRAAVERRLVSDVPTGVLLSGGLDSSLIVALLADRAADMPETFSIGFETVGGVEGNEFKYSDLIAKHFGTRHHRLRIDAARTLDALPDAIAAMSEPMMSHDAVGFYLLSEEVSKYVKVVQSGQGADEVFGGYHWYPKLVGSKDVTADYAKAYFDRDHREMCEVLSPDYLDDDYSRAFVDRYFDSVASPSPVDKALQLDTAIMLVDDPVKRVDNMTMAWGLEARVPFLDHELVEFAARIPAGLKVREGGKYILKEAARAVVPAEIIDRPKGYFPVPALKFIRGPILDFVRDVLTSSTARGRGLFQPSYVGRLLANPEGELTPKGNSKLWQIAVLEYWLQAHGL
jgi:asparagine synthase (glutamine-hydrolysing)